MPNFFIRERKSSVHFQRAAAPSAPPTRHCKQLAPVRSHHAAFFHIRQQRWFGRFANLSFSSDLLDVMLRGMRERDRICFTEFSNRRLKRFAARDDHPRSMKFSSSRMCLASQAVSPFMTAGE